MADSFEPVLALLRECLNIHGEDYETLREVVGVGAASMISAWVNGTAVPNANDWESIAQRIRQHLAVLQRHAAEHGARELAAWQRRKTGGETSEELARVGATYRQAITAARAALRVPFPGPLDSLERIAADENATTGQLHEAIRASVVTVRERSGKTRRALADEIGSAVTCVEYFGCGRIRERLMYRTEQIVDMLVGLARYVAAHAAQFDPSAEIGAAAAIAAARAIMRDRPPRPEYHAKGLTTVRWDRIASLLDAGTHRFFQYRCPSGEFAIVVFVRLCIAYEQSRLTTAKAALLSGLRVNQLGDWFNGRVFPDYTMLAKMEKAIERFEGESAAPVAPVHESAAPSPLVPPAPVARPVSPRTPPPVEPPRRTASASVHNAGASDFLISAASIFRGLQKQRRAGWVPDDSGRRHLAAIVEEAIEIGGLTVADFRPKDDTIGIGDEQSASVRAVLDAFPQLRDARGVPPDGRR